MSKISWVGLFFAGCFFIVLAFLFGGGLALMGEPVVFAWVLLGIGLGFLAVCILKLFLSILNLF